MVEIIDSFGKTFLICISVSVVFVLAFFGIRSEGKKGIMEVAGAQSENLAQRVESGIAQDDAYKEFLETPGSIVELTKELHANESYNVKDIFNVDDSVVMILLMDAYDYLTGEDAKEAIFQGGEQVCFRKSGLYVIKIWSLNSHKVETKQSFYLSVK